MTYNTQAIVLKTYKWPRHARLYIFYSKRFGKIKGVGRGVQKVKSKVAGHLAPFMVSEVMLAQGRSIDRLIQGRVLKRHAGFENNWQQFSAGSYMLEIVDRLTQEGVADDYIWNIITTVFEELDNQGKWLESSQQIQLHHLTRISAFQLLAHLGYRPELEKCMHCEKALLADSIFFSVLHGGTVCKDCHSHYPEAYQVSIDLIKFFRLAMENDLRMVSKISMPYELLLQSHSIIDQFVSYHTQHPIYSASFRETVNR